MVDGIPDINLERIENELKDLKKIIYLYNGLPEKKPGNEFIRKIQLMIKKYQLKIFQEK